MNNNFNQQPGFQQPMYQQPQQPQQANGPFNVKALLGLILGGVGFLGFCLSWYPWIGIFTFFASVAGLIFGVMGMGHAKKYGGNGLAIAGLIVGIIGVFFGFIGLICASCYTCAYCEAASRVSSYYSYF